MAQSLSTSHAPLHRLQQCFAAIACLLLSVTALPVFSQGTWAPVINLSPNSSGGGMLLLSDGTVICKSTAGGGDGIGSIYSKLTPDSTGSYANGSWSSIAAMSKTRLYYSSQVLKDGRVYVAGGEYGTGGSAGETYNPLTNTWTSNGAIGSVVSDANSEIIDDGRVLQALVSGTLKNTKFYDPVSNTYSTGPTCIGIHNESVWVKLPDNSILFVDRGSTNSERYIPALNQWVADATVPVSLYDPYGLEQGGGLLLPDGRAIYFGSTGHNAIYTPSGNNTPGSWVAAPDFPNGQGTPDAPAAMMVNGKILCAVSPKPTSSNHFPTPTSYYEYNYLTDSFTRVNAPGGGLTSNYSVYTTNMLDLPNGQVLFTTQGSNQYYVYTPDGTPLASGKPKIKKGTLVSPGVYMITGNLFNGISEGATYGDDWQMNSNYPIVRLTAGTHVYYARTYNWNSTGVMRGTLADTAYMTLPPGLPKGKYKAVVIANGISSNPATITVNNAVPIAGNTEQQNSIADALTASLKPVVTTEMKVYPNPASLQTTLSFSLAKASHVSVTLADANGRTIQSVANDSRQPGTYTIPLNVSKLAHGVYYIKLMTDSETKNTKLIVL